MYCLTGIIKHSKGCDKWLWTISAMLISKQLHGSESSSEAKKGSVCQERPFRERGARRLIAMLTRPHHWAYSELFCYSLNNISLRFVLILYFYLWLAVWSDLFSVVPPNKIVRMCSFPPLPSRLLIFLSFITLIIMAVVSEACKLWIASLYNFKCPVTFPLLDQNILFSSLFSDTFILFSSFWEDSRTVSALLTEKREHIWKSLLDTKYFAVRNWRLTAKPMPVIWQSYEFISSLVTTRGTFNYNIISASDYLGLR
jgi:hypothetical protein